jgi:hypothetical protein
MVRLVTAAAVIMGVLIVAGTATLIALVVWRPAASSGPAPVAAAASVLDEPPGTRIAAASGSTEGLVLVLQGGGPDRVVVVDPQSGRVAGRVRLAR